MSKGQRNALPTLAPVEPVAVVEEETAEEVTQPTSDIVYVTITVPVSIAPRGTVPRRCDVKMKSHHRAIARQLHDGFDSNNEALSNGTFVKSSTIAILKLFEVIEVALAEKRKSGKAD